MTGMDEAGISGVNIDGAKGKISEVMAAIVSAFDRQLDALYQGEVMDINAEIKVLQSLLTRRRSGRRSDGRSLTGSVRYRYRRYLMNEQEHIPQLTLDPEGAAAATQSTPAAPAVPTLTLASESAAPAEAEAVDPVVAG